MSKHIETPDTLLRSNGLRITPARMAVLEVLMHQQGPISHQQLEGLLNQNGSHIDRVTIYRTLHSLTECGILHKITGADRTFSYGYRNDDNQEEHHGMEHPHFVCEKCAHTYCLPDVPILNSIATPSGFELKHTEIKLFGYCPECN